MKRKIIKIDEEKCTGCGLCIPNCPEGAIQIIDGKARLVSDLFCDGLGECIGHCPEGAISVELRNAEPYDENRVMKNIASQGTNTIRAHLKHLKDHGQDLYYNQAIDYLKKHNINIPEEKKMDRCANLHTSCPGSKTVTFKEEESGGELSGKRASHLHHWPVQMHLISTDSDHFKESDLLLAADCTAFTTGDFHKDYLKGKTLAIACPKLDEGQKIYVEKLKSLIDEAKINTLTVMIMEVPCCTVLVNLAQKALQKASRKIPIKLIVMSIRGEVLREEWL